MPKLRDLPVQTWSYRVDRDDIRHIGPKAQNDSLHAQVTDLSDRLARLDAALRKQQQ